MSGMHVLIETIPDSPHMDVQGQDANEGLEIPRATFLAWTYAKDEGTPEDRTEAERAIMVHLASTEQVTPELSTAFGWLLP